MRKHPGEARRRSGRRAGRVAAAAALLTLGLPAAANALSHTMVGELKLDLPDAAEGWTRKPGSGNAILLQKEFRDGERKGAALIQILQPIRSGSFEANWRTMVDTVPELAAEDPRPKATGKTLGGQLIRMESRCCASRSDVSMASINVGIQTASGQHFLTLVTLNLDRDGRRSAEDEFQRLVRSARPSGQSGPPVLTPPENGGGLEGVYTSLYTGVTPNAFGGMDFVSDSRVMAFDPSGLYSREIPEGGADIAAHCRREPAGCGTYSLSGGGLLRGPERIELNEVAGDYAIVETESQPFERDGGDMKLGETEWTRIPPLPRGTPFEGTWRFFWASSGTTAFSSGGVSSERLLTMTADGTFTRSGSYGVTSSYEGGGSTTGVAGSGDHPLEQGRYEVEGYALKLTGAGGRTETLSLFAPEQGSDGLLVINGNNYLKQDGTN